MIPLEADVLVAGFGGAVMYAAIARRARRRNHYGADDHRRNAG